MYMSSKGFIYRDLKPSNILLMADGNIKLIDLGGVIYKHDGLCKPLTTHANTPKGSSSSTVLRYGTIVLLLLDVLIVRSR